MNSPKVAVVILNWNGLSHFQNFLDSVWKNSHLDGEVWIIDNGSSDGSMEHVREYYPEIKTILLDKNFGFAEGYNKGLKEISADIYVLLNSDVEVRANWIPPVISCMAEDQNIAACQPKILDYNHREYFEHAGAAGGFIDKQGFPFCAGRIFDSFERDEGQYDQNREVFWASGAALFVKSKLYHEVGGLDSDFFAHMEEIDLCWRLKNRGYTISACGASSVLHVGGGTLNKVDPHKTYLNFRNNLYLLIKNDFRSGFIFRMWWRLFVDGIAAFRFLTEGKPKFVLAVLKAHLSFFGNLPKTLRKRKSIKKNLNNPNIFGLYRKSILIEYFFKKKTKFTQLDQKFFK